MYIVFSRSYNKNAAREFSEQNIESCKRRARALELSLIRVFLSLFVQRDSYRFNFPSVLYVNILREITIPRKIISSSLWENSQTLLFIFVEILIDVQTRLPKTSRDLSRLSPAASTFPSKIRVLLLSDFFLPE